MAQKREEDEQATSDVPDGVSAFLAKVLDQLSLSAWLPAALLVTSLTAMLTIRAQPNLEPLKALGTIVDHPWSIVLLAVPGVILATMLTQAFSFESIRVLEGYWPRIVLATGGSQMIKLQLARRERLRAARERLVNHGFSVARERMLDGGVPRTVVDAIEADIRHWARPKMTDDEIARLSKTQWKALAPAWELAKIDAIEQHLAEHPRTSRTLPMRLGNVVRATEDRLRNSGSEIEGFVFRAREAAPPRIRVQHDQFRTRLDMYCTMTFTALAVALGAPLILKDTTLWWQGAAICSGAFVVLARVSYLAAIASARGYCSILRYLDELRDAPASTSP